MGRRLPVPTWARSPTRLVTAGANVAQRVLYGGLADLRPMPRTRVDAGPIGEVFCYRSGTGAPSAGLPVLLVAPLAAPARCYDLRRGCSLVEHLVGTQRPTYLVDFGEVPLAERHLGVGRCVDETLPGAVGVVSEHAGGEPVHLVGWGVGGVLAALTAADRSDLPIASVTAIASPVDLGRVPLVRRGVQLPVVGPLLASAVAAGLHLHDADYLAHREAVDRLEAGTRDYRGRAFGQLYHRLLRASSLSDGAVTLDHRRVELAELQVPLLVVAGADDEIAPVEAVRPLVDLATGTTGRFEVVAGGHLDVLTGRAAHSTTWPLLDDFLRDVDRR